MQSEQKPLCADDVIPGKIARPRRLSCQLWPARRPHRGLPLFHREPPQLEKLRFRQTPTVPRRYAALRVPPHHVLVVMVYHSYDPPPECHFEFRLGWQRLRPDF
jgi:hypothetical protein